MYHIKYAHLNMIMHVYIYKYMYINIYAYICVYPHMSNMDYYTVNIVLCWFCLNYIAYIFDNIR